MPLSQSRLAQSAFFLQAASVGHGPHALPPQSMSVSVPAISPSVQAGPTQTRAAEQPPVAQSLFTWHPNPVVQGARAAPPQFGPVSSPFFVLSVQVGVAQ